MRSHLSRPACPVTPSKNIGDNLLDLSLAWAISRHNRRNYRKQRNKPSLGRTVYLERFSKSSNAFDFEILPEVCLRGLEKKRYL
ncbi:unnamed protein product [Rhizophagus irregularis]|nr:unnamed protein product [Rhizophagus irregularis]CAB4404670.1 unnamed protein product [Rhizophagus irregularis]